MPNNQIPNQNRLTGLNTLAYMGTEATTPPQFVIENRDPTPNDLQNFRIGTFWLKKKTQHLWILIDRNYTDPSTGTLLPARWVLINGDAASVFVTDNGTAYPIEETINMLGGANIGTEALAPNQDTVSMYLKNDVIIGNTLSVASFLSAGIITSTAGGLLQTSNGTDQQIMVARAAGPVWANLTSTGHTVVITNNGNNINLESVGGGGGGGLSGVVADDGNTVLPPALPAPQVISILGSDVIKTKGNIAQTLTIDVEDSTSAGDLIIGGGAGVDSVWGKLSSTSGDVTFNYIAAGTDPLILYPRLNLTVPGGAGGFGGLKDQTGVIAAPDGSHTVKVAGQLPFTTSAAGSTITINSGAPTTPNTNGSVLISSEAGDPVWARITGSGGITVTTGNGSISLTGSGGGGGGGASTFHTDNGGDAVPVGGVLNVYGVAPSGGYDNITTSCVPSGTNTLKIALNNYIQLPSTNALGTTGMIMINGNNFMHAYGTNNTFLGSSAGSTGFGTYLTSVTNNVAVGSNALNGITKYAAHNTAVGSNALTALIGNTALTPSDSNTAIGNSALAALTTGAKNTVVGAYAGNVLTTGSGSVLIGYQAGTSLTGSASNCTAVGYQAGSGLTTGGDDCVLLGYRAGNALGTQTNVIAIGNTGAGLATNTISIGNAAHSSAYMQGIYSNLSSGTYKLTTISSTNQLEALTTGANGKFLKSNGTSPVWVNGVASYLFIAYPAATTNVTGDNTQYFLGSEAGKAMTLVQNVGGATYSLGSAGVAAQYVIPVDGSYWLTFNIRLNGLVAPIVMPPPPPPPPPAHVDPVVIAVYRGGVLTYEWATYPNTRYNGYQPYVSSYIGIIQQLQANDVIKWYIQLDYRPGESIAGAWPLTYNQQSKTIGLDTTDGTLLFSQVGVCLLVD